jgi:hypothetical protein
MIDSTSSPDRAARATALPSELAKSPSYRTGGGSDRLSTDKAEQLRAALTAQPAIRPEVVARGKSLAADPSYPPAGVIGQVAAQIVNSPDLSEDQS